MTYEKFFADVKKAYSRADKRRLREDFAFQFNITGEGEGIFYVAYRGGILEVAPYDYVDRNATLYASGENFVKLANGKFTLEEAVKSGQISVDGDYNLTLVLDKMASKEASEAKEKKSPAEKSALKKTEVKKTGTVRRPPQPSAPSTANRETLVTPAAYNNVASAAVDIVTAENAVNVTPPVEDEVE